MKRSLFALAFATFVGVAVAGAWPEFSPPGIPDAGPTIWWILLGLKSLGDLASVLVVGLLVYRLFVIPDEDGRLGRTKTTVSLEVASWIWLLGAVARIVVGLAEELGIPLSSALDSTIIRSYLTQTSLGRYLTAQIIFLALLVPAIALVKRWFSAFAMLLVAGVALILPALTGHAAASSNHSLALGSISLHLWAVATWVGVVFGYLRDRINFPRVSAIAFASAVAVALTGSMNALVRFTAWSDFTSDYGRLLLIKISLFIAALTLGYQARKGRERLGIEIAVMSSIIGISAVLASVQPPIPRVIEATTAAQELTGSPMLEAPTLLRVFTTWSLDGFSLALSLAMILAYFVGVRTLRRRGDSWPISRSIFFMSGALAFIVASNGGLAAYAKLAFSYHMLAHMVIVTLAPIGIVLGAPITLALRTLPQGKEVNERGSRGHLQAALNSKPIWFLSHPVWALVVFDASLFGLYFSGAFADLMRWHIGHTIMDIHFLAVGLLFFYTIVGVDPNPHRTPFIVRIVLLLAAMSLHAFFSVALMSTSELLDGGYFSQLQRPWSTDLLADQHLGGALGWALGEIPIVLALIATFTQWVRADNREARRIDRAAERAEARGEHDELAAYNAYLQRLAERDGDH